MTHMNSKEELVLNLLSSILSPPLPTKQADTGSLEMISGSSSGMVGEFVIVRCRDAGVHAGTLVSHSGRECTLHGSRRLWYWVVPEGAPAFLSGVATHGLGLGCKVGGTVDIHLTENCEIIRCTDAAKDSILGYEVHKRDK